MLASEILIKARALIEKPENWTQRASARDATGESLSEYRSDAVCFCARGALGKVALDWDDFTAAKQLLRDAAVSLKFDGIVQLNDSADHPTVLRMFDLAISKALSSEVTA